MIFDKCKIKIFVKNEVYPFHYAYNSDTTFQDLLEYFSFLFPKLNICECYHFLASEQKENIDEKCILISFKSKISDYSNYLKNLVLNRKKDNCLHSRQKYYLHASKKKIISSLKKKIKKKNKEIDDLKKEIERLKKTTKDKVVLEEQNNTNPKDFYDVIAHIDSIKDINKGWEIEMNEIGEKNYKNFKSENILKIGVIGNANKGKSFLLSKISKMNLPSGVSIKTAGLSIKYPELKEFKNRKIALLDSAGLETPVLISKPILDEIEKNKLFKDKSREKLITELFLQNYIVNNSDILIVVVDCLSFSEQKLLLKVKKEVEREKGTMNLYIIHNLKTFTSVNQVKDYIKDTLLKSATFTLIKGDIINTKIESKTGVFYFEKKNEDKDSNIFHLIYANEESEAGKYYNKFTLDFIENSFQGITNYQPYDVIESIKDRYIHISEDIIEKTEKNEKITKESFDNSKPKLIKLKNEKEIILKKCFIDELGFSNLKSNGFEPKYNIFSKDNKLIIRVEIPGNCNIVADKDSMGDYNIIKLSGEKKKDVEPEKLEDNIYNRREFGIFFLDIPINSKLYHIIDEKPSINQKKGVCFIEYKLGEKLKPTGYNNSDDEI